MDPSSLGLLDPSSYRIAEPENPFAVAKPDVGRDEFLRLLVTQLENQDPLEPIDDKEFVSQLATFSSLEQLIDLNAGIGGILAGQEQLVNSQALELIGHDVLVASSGRFRLREGGSDEIVYELAERVASTRVDVFDGAGTLVRKIELDHTEPGRHSATWDGLNEDGEALPPGDYEFRIVAQTRSGGEQAVAGMLSIPIEGVQFAAGGLALVSGSELIDFSQILEIRNSSAESGDEEGGA